MTNHWKKQFIVIKSIAAALLIVSSDASAQPISTTGQPFYYNSSQGQVTLRIFGEDVFGHYSNDNGRINGTFRQNVFNGY